MPLLDSLGLGPWRRRRRLERQLRDLESLADLPSVPLRTRSHRRPARRSRQRLGGERGRSLLVLLTTIAVMAGLVVVYAPNLLPGDVLPARLERLLGRAPLGEAPDATGGSYAFAQSQPGAPEKPVAYDPCREIHVVLNPEGAPDYAESLVRRSIATVSTATGLKLVYDGTSDRRPSWTRSGPEVDLRRPEPVLVAFATEEEVSQLEGRVAGVGGSISVGPRTGPRRYVTGQVTLDSEGYEQLAERPDEEEEALAIMLHEFGHLVGLAHVSDRGELMYAENLDRQTFGPGDRSGLAALGRGRCF